MIDLSQELIFSLLLKALILGAVLGVMYEPVRLSRLVLDVGDRKVRGRAERARSAFCTILTFLSDILFCLVFALVALLLTYNVSGGVFRGGVYFLMLIGLIVYRATLGRLTLFAQRWVARIIRSVVRGAIKIIFIPLRAIFLLFSRIYALTIGAFLGKIRYKRKQRLEQKLKERQSEMQEALMPGISEKEDKDAKGSREYKKENRISFGGHRGA